ncbi:hypothetical protein ACFVVM_17015 [Nocardia sp. NPDC058176]|uniref:hypothetical protein n=1 Tax=Nocardia sp. NPDC058176 TaxID=3346368 RepID=UPI0036DB165A
MKKLRTLGLGIVLAAGMVLLGTGVSAAEEPSTGSAEGLAAVLESLSSGSAGDDATDGDDVSEKEETEASTGSAEGLAALLEALISGSAGGDDATDGDTVADETETGSAEGIAALLKALTTGSSDGDDAADPDATS